MTSQADLVTVLQLTGAYPEAAVAGNDALLRALFHHPAAVVCDLSAVSGSLEKTSVRRLLDTGGHLEHWPATPVSLVSTERGLPRLLQVADASSVPIAATITDALGALKDHPAPVTSTVHLDAHPVASRIARDFVSRTCLDWHLAHGIPSAVLVVSELVNNGLRHAGTDMDLTLCADGTRLKLALRDGSGQPPRMIRTGGERGRGRGMHIVEGFSRAWGTLPAPDGGKAVWVVLDA